MKKYIFSVISICAMSNIFTPTFTCALSRIAVGTRIILEDLAVGKSSAQVVISVESEVHAVIIVLALFQATLHVVHLPVTNQKTLCALSWLVAGWFSCLT